MSKHPRDTYYTPPKELWGGIWKPILESPNYMINEYGVFKSLHRKVLSKNGVLRIVREKIKVWEISSVGYARVLISMGKDRKRIVLRKSVHRLVARAFCDDFSKYPQINHEDGNKLNNHYTNLKPCDQSYNQKHASDTGLNVQDKAWQDSQSKSIIQFNLDSVEVARYGSMCEAERVTGISRTSIKNSCNGITGRRWNHPYHFKFLQSEP